MVGAGDYGDWTNPTMFSRENIVMQAHPPQTPGTADFLACVRQLRIATAYRARNPKTSHSFPARHAAGHACRPITPVRECPGYRG